MIKLIILLRWNLYQIKRLKLRKRASGHKSTPAETASLKIPLVGIIKLISIQSEHAKLETIGNHY